MELTDLAPILAVPAVTKALDAYRQLVLERDFRKFAFTVGAWIVGVGLAFLVAASSAGEGLSDNPADLILLGIGLGSTASVVSDFAKRGDTKVIAETATVIGEPDEVEVVG